MRLDLLKISRNNIARRVHAKYGVRGLLRAHDIVVILATSLFWLLVFAAALVLISSNACAHPGHGETLHAHPELWAVLVLVASAIAYARRKVVA